MTKKQLAEKLAKKVGLTRKASLQSVNGAFTLIKESLSKGEKVVISGFGTFIVRKRATRTGRNPQTGNAISIPAHKLPSFIAGKTFKRIVK